jgi:hypothetical protein
VPGTAAKNEPESMDDALHSGCSSREWHRNAFAELFSEYLPWAERPPAAKAPDHDFDLHGTTVRWQICQRPLITTMDLCRGAAAAWAGCCPRWRSRNGDNLVESNLELFDSEAVRRQRTE